MQENWGNGSQRKLLHGGNQEPDKEPIAEDFKQRYNQTDQQGQWKQQKDSSLGSCSNAGVAKLADGLSGAQNLECHSMQIVLANSLQIDKVPQDILQSLIMNYYSLLSFTLFMRSPTHYQKHHILSMN